MRFHCELDAMIGAARCARRGRRPAFTLIELMVVVFIIMVLASIVLAFLPSRQSRLAAQGADQLQTFIASARSRALRDQAPRGVRLIPTTVNGHSVFTEFELVEVPEPYAPGVALSIPAESAPGGPAGRKKGAGGAGGAVVASVNDPNLINVVQAGDFLELMVGSGSIHRIASAPTPSTTFPGGYDVTLVSAVAPSYTVPEAAMAPLNLSNVPATSSAANTASGTFRFIRQARPLMGEPAFQLPNTVYVHPILSAAQAKTGTSAGSLNIPQSYDGSHWEIVFAPSGQVINATGGRIVLWVADEIGVSRPTLLTIYSRTGSVSAQAEGPASNLFAYTQDGRSSGQ
jgi:prepilin-type N-terminal cleavage/methylation domain-containing protein